MSGYGGSLNVEAIMMMIHHNSNDQIAWVGRQFPDLSNLKLLDKGGQKIVFSARHTTEGEVVLKLLLYESGDLRLKREVLAVKLIRCDHVPRIYDTGMLMTPLGEYMWVREERVRGETLRKLIQLSTLEYNVVLRLGLQLLDTLVVAEKNRIVHRDIKPENVMMDQSGDFWLLDFGLARHLDLESLTATPARYGVGTIGYSAPEQMRNRKREIDSRADLFALGVLLYECIIGINPFVKCARDQREILQRIEQQPMPLLQHPADVGDGLRDFIAALTQKYPSQRPRTVKDAKMWFKEIVKYFEKSNK